MKKELLSFAFSCSLITVMAQKSTSVSSPTEKQTYSADLAMWGYHSADNFVPASWNMLYVGDDLFEVRYNFDQSDALSLYYGHRFKKEMGSIDFSFTPALGVTKYGPLSNIGLTTHTIFEGEQWRLYTINQYNLATSPGASDITYHWIDFGYHATDWLVLGVSDQYYQVGDADGNFDLGPSLGFEFGNLYAKTYAWDFWSEEDRYYGLWWGWYFSNEK